MRAKEFITEESKAARYNGLLMKYAFNDSALVLKAFDPTKTPIAYVKFVKEDKELYPQDLWVNDDFRNRGIAKSMYDFLKSEGYIINRSHDQTKAGAGFWDKHRGEDEYVWEQMTESKMVDYDGIQMNVSIDGANIDIRAMSGDHQMGYVVFERDGNTVIPLDLAIDDAHKGQGIAKSMYDYVKSLGFKIQASPDQTSAGKKFWEKNRGEERVWEEINPDITNSKFKHTQEIGGYTYKAYVEIFLDDPLLYIKAYDGNKEIGSAMFEIFDWENPEQGWMESGGTEVLPKYRGKNIAHTMYAYAKMLGNDIKPSHNRTTMGKNMWQGWGSDVKHLTNEDVGNTTTLNQLYNGNFPDRDESFWDEVTPSDFDKELTIQTMPRHKVQIMLLSQYRVEHLDEISDMMDEDQQEVVQRYMNDPALSSKVIVISGHRIIDGNHRALAAAFKGVPINYVDLADLDGEDLDEEVLDEMPLPADWDPTQ